LREGRVALSKSKFIDAISRLGGDAEAADILYSKLQDWIYAEDFTAYPEDNLGSVFGIAEEELDEDLILDIINELGLAVPTQAQMREFGPVETALDVARLAAFIRANQ
jgi:hypothetical protein